MPHGSVQSELRNASITDLRVFRVSCLNLVPGAKLQISRPTDEPPSASCNIRVSFEFRYGIRDYQQFVTSRDGDLWSSLLTAP